MKAKVVSIKRKATVSPTGCTVEKVPLEECKKLLNADDISYTDEEVEIIQDFTYRFAEIIYLCYVEKKQDENIQQDNNGIENNKISNISNADSIKNKYRI